MKNLKEIILLFLKLGVIAFGGPAAHIGMMEDEVVTRKKWMSREYFMDLLGATNLIPGPNSTEMAIHCGYIKAGIPGLIAAGISFIMPAVLITGFLAHLYILYGKIPEVEPFLYGIKPAVIIIIVNAVYKLGKKSFKNIKLVIIGVAAFLLNILGLNEIFSILSAGILGAAFIYFSEKRNLNFFLMPFLLTIIHYTFRIIEKEDFSFSKLFLVFLKIGAVLFGSGYVLIAYLDGEIVQGLHWLTRKELLDAIAIGQFTPGPVLSSATFIGYILGGIPGAAIATAGIFLPSFIFVLIVNPFISRLRQSKLFSAFLDAVNVSVLAVMTVVALKLGSEVLVEWKAILIALVSAILFLFIKKINSVYIVAGGAAAGYLLSFF